VQITNPKRLSLGLVNVVVDGWGIGGVLGVINPISKIVMDIDNVKRLVLRAALSVDSSKPTNVFLRGHGRNGHIVQPQVVQHTTKTQPVVLETPRVVRSILCLEHPRSLGESILGLVAETSRIQSIDTHPRDVDSRHGLLVASVQVTEIDTREPNVKGTEVWNGGWLAFRQKRVGAFNPLNLSKKAGNDSLHGLRVHEISCQNRHRHQPAFCRSVDTNLVNTPHWERASCFVEHAQQVLNVS